MSAGKKRRAACVLLTWFLLASNPVTAQQAQGRDPIAENLFPPDLVLANQKAIVANQKKILSKR